MLLNLTKSQFLLAELDKLTRQLSLVNPTDLQLRKLIQHLRLYITAPDQVNAEELMQALTSLRKILTSYGKETAALLPVLDRIADETDYQLTRQRVSLASHKLTSRHQPLSAIKNNLPATKNSLPATRTTIMSKHQRLSQQSELFQRLALFGDRGDFLQHLAKQAQQNPMLARDHVYNARVNFADAANAKYNADRTNFPATAALYTLRDPKSPIKKSCKPLP